MSRTIELGRDRHTGEQFFRPDATAIARSRKAGRLHLRRHWGLNLQLVKILAIQFRYLGDAVLMTPALWAIKEHFAGVALHVVVAQEIVPVLQHLPWIEHVWGLPRKRGHKTLLKSWPVISFETENSFQRR